MNLAKSVSSDQEIDQEEMRDIVIIGYTTVGIINGIGQSTLQVDARELVIPDRNVVKYSVRVELSSGGDYPTEAFATIEYEYIERLILMLKRLETTSISTDRFALSEVQYEITDLKVIVFNTSQGPTMAAVQAGGISVHLNSPTKIASFTNLVEKAKYHLDTHKLA